MQPHAPVFGTSVEGGSFELIGNDGSAFGLPRISPDRVHPEAEALRSQLSVSQTLLAALRAEHERIERKLHSVQSTIRGLELQLAPPRLSCDEDCACWVALESTHTALPSLSRAQLVEWMAALVGPPQGAAAHKRMYHHERSTKPESPLNLGYVGLAKGYSALGLTAQQYREVKEAVRSTDAATLIELLGGVQRAVEYGITLTAQPARNREPQVTWQFFCPLIWREGGPASVALHTRS